MILGERISFLLYSLWNWITNTGIDLAIILVLGFLIPRFGRIGMRIIKRRVESTADADTTKNQLAFAGVGLYIAQIVAFFMLAIAAMQLFGFSLAGAAIPATIASAAIGLGAQSIVADFLAGFFILTEKQFGVGDWVRFEGNGIIVEGTVIEITMRATKIRTIAQQTVIIPNSTAKVCINNSNSWSRAVVLMPIPMLGSDNITDVIARSEAATRRALTQEIIAPEILGELDVHPAIDVTPPSVVGMPWMVTMRFLVQVTAGNQWLVERAIRTEIISEFWEEYGSATTTSGTLIDSLSVVQEKNPLIDASPNALQEPKPEAAATVASLAASSNDDAAKTVISPGNPEKGLDSEVMEQELSVEEDTPEEHASLQKFFRTDFYPKRWQKILSLGGRVRMSTSLLLAALMVLSLTKVLMIEPNENWQNSTGRFAPQSTTTTSETPTQLPSSSIVSPSVPVSPTVESSVETQPETATSQPRSTAEQTEEPTEEQPSTTPSTTVPETTPQTPETSSPAQETATPMSTP